MTTTMAPPDAPLLARTARLAAAVPSADAAEARTLVRAGPAELLWAVARPYGG